MFVTVLKGNESSPAKQARDIDYYSHTDKTTTVTIGSVVWVMDGPHSFANLFCYFSVSEMQRDVKHLNPEGDFGSEACKVASLSYRFRTIKLLSKLQGSAARILSTSALLSKEKRITCSSICLTLKPDFALQRGVKVLAMASIFSGRLVRNRAAMEISELACSFFRQRP